MNTFKRLALVVTLVVAMGAGFGCAKKQTGADVAPATTADDNGAANAAIERAAQAITDGIVYFDFVPGKDYEGNPSFSFDVSTTYSRYIGFNSARQEISTEINNAIIESNFKRTLRTSSGN